MLAVSDSAIGRKGVTRNLDSYADISRITFVYCKIVDLLYFMEEIQNIKAATICSKI